MVRTVMSASDNNAGFTLIELLVVMAIMALLAVLLIPALTNASRHRFGEHGAAALVSALNSAREQARSAGHRVVFAQDQWPTGSRWQARVPAGSVEPAFFADGSATGGQLLLNDGTIIAISWIDGHVQSRRQ